MHAQKRAATVFERATGVATTLPRNTAVKNVQVTSQRRKLAWSNCVLVIVLLDLQLTGHSCPLRIKKYLISRIAKRSIRLFECGNVEIRQLIVIARSMHIFWFIELFQKIFLKRPIKMSDKWFEGIFEFSQ